MRHFEAAVQTNMEFSKCLVVLGAFAFLLLSPSVAVCPLITPPSAFFPSIPEVRSSPINSHVSAKLESTIASFLTTKSIPLYAVSVVHEDQTVFTSGLATSRFLIGSISKTFTALGALILRERGLLSLDDPVKKFLSNFSINNPYEPHDITLRELMGHLSGLPRELCADLYVKGQSEGKCPVEESDVLKAVAKMQLIQPPWSREPAYSNLGFALLGHAWEKATSPSKSWEEFVMEDIVEPLGLNDTGVDLTNITLAANESAANYGIGWLGPAGTLYSTAADLAKYLIFLLKGSPALISRPTVREWTRSTTILPDGKGGYALPWELLTINSTVGREFLITKGGTIANYKTVIAFHPPTQLGISVLFIFNESTLAGPAVLMEELLNILIPVVETANAKIINSFYAGHYVCKPTPPTFSQPLNATVEVLGGVFNVTGSPSLGLSLSFSLSTLQDGKPGGASGTEAMLLKNATENSFWHELDTDCLNFSVRIASSPSITDPNTPGSTYLDEIKFDLTNRTLLWPAVGAICVRQDTAAGHDIALATSHRGHHPLMYSLRA